MTCSNLLTPPNPSLPWQSPAHTSLFSLLTPHSICWRFEVHFYGKEEDVTYPLSSLGPFLRGLGGSRGVKVLHLYNAFLSSL